MPRKLINAIKEHSLPLNDQSLDKVIEAIGNAQIVMIGEASHGTSEFYTYRCELSKRLIEQKGFNIIAVEGDWPSAQEVNRYVKGYGDESQTARELLMKSFHRWPTWMWANEEIEQFTEWLKEKNTSLDKKVGFYGIDLYSLFESIDEVLKFLSDNPKYQVDLEHAKKAFTCFEPYNRMPEHYALSAAHFTDECISEVSSLLRSLRSNEERYSDEQEKDLNVIMNALVAKNAEEYYREMMKDAKSWNTRDEHMVEAINELIKYHGDDAKIIIWEHNTHIGDASETSMKDEQMINVGQLIREQYGKDNTFAIGFGTYEGTVIASDSWGDPLQVIKVPPSKLSMWEGQLHAASQEDQVLIFTDDNRELFTDWIGHRAIGVVYHPEYEAYGNYVPSRVGSRYDAFIFIDQTNALRPLK
ncbi:erythromycin esterase-like protein [Lysinibacillus composti]|uniref:Erythromycin esterase family protein n=1 Tax=Lysinibacillus composti TaxID=720633 RepID=A0A3N9UE25_9BACI|nr:erythromycin esterase family protein [Lysinibacillus composti]MBM7608967.1 erythromycin esterase-like protein [Lysinibacillus composti]RQW74534.1 erythromycin esterase family protein [Lysinibacillus composti]